MAYFDKDKVKFSLTLDDVARLLQALGGEPIVIGNNLIMAKTICHNGDSHKLYYYDNTHLFKCYTNCPDGAFDIYELVCRYMNSRDILIDEHEWEMVDAVTFITRFYEIAPEEEDFSNQKSQLDDWKIFQKKNKKTKENNNKNITLKKFDDKIIDNLPKVRIAPWEREGITDEVMQARNIKYNPITESIIIPHYDIDGYLVGIRERALIKENEVYGKYRPASFRGQMYNHPLGYNLYNLNFSKDNIKALKKVIVFEGEKSCLLYSSYFGLDNDISVAVCGSNFQPYHYLLLSSLGVEEIIIAFDKQFKAIGDAEWEKWIKKLYYMDSRYNKFCQMSFMFDKEDTLGYKNSPIDEGKEKFLDLFKKRIYIDDKDLILIEKYDILKENKRK